MTNQMKTDKDGYFKSKKGVGYYLGALIIFLLFVVFLIKAYLVYIALSV